MLARAVMLSRGNLRQGAGDPFLSSAGQLTITVSGRILNGFDSRVDEKPLSVSGDHEPIAEGQRQAALEQLMRKVRIESVNRRSDDHRCRRHRRRPYSELQARG